MSHAGHVCHVLLPAKSKIAVLYIVCPLHAYKSERKGSTRVRLSTLVIWVERVSLSVVRWFKLVTVINIRKPLYFSGREKPVPLGRSSSYIAGQNFEPALVNATKGNFTSFHTHTHPFFVWVYFLSMLAWEQALRVARIGGKNMLICHTWLIKFKPVL